MELKYISLLMGILMIGSVAAYIADSSSYVTLTLDETTYYVADSSSYVTLTLTETDVTDTCTYDGSGDWVVDCNDNCTITDDTDIGENQLVLAGTGSFTILSDITVGSVAKSPTCKLNNVPEDGNSLAIRGN